MNGTAAKQRVHDDNLFPSVQVKTPELLTNEYSYCDESTHIFYCCRLINKPYDKQILGIYGNRLDSCNMKFRYAAKAYLAVKRVFSELEHGEFIYFDDANRLEVGFYIESMLIFLRASLDLALGAYHIYFAGTAKLDSMNDLLKAKEERIGWIPETGRAFWNSLRVDYAASDFHWIHALTGRDRGMSLRDIAVHRSLIEVETFIDDRDRGRFYIQLTKDTEGHAHTWVDAIYDGVADTLDQICADIFVAEQQTV